MATASAVSANKAELIAIADAVAREKLIDRMIVIEAMEDAIQRAARARYGAENDIRAKLDPTSGDLRLWRVVEVVEEVEDYFKQVSLEDSQKRSRRPARRHHPIHCRRSSSAASPPGPQSRSSSESPRRRRERQFEEFKTAPAIITGVVKRVESATSSSTRPCRGRHPPRPADPAGTSRRRPHPQLISSIPRNRGRRSACPRASDFMKKLFAQEVPKRRHHRDQGGRARSGSRAKIGVLSHDSSIDPVGACVMKGSRVEAVVRELQGERSTSFLVARPATFVVNALQPATVSRVVIGEEESRIEVVVPDDQLSPRSAAAARMPSPAS